MAREVKRDEANIWKSVVETGNETLAFLRPKGHDGLQFTLPASNFLNAGCST